MDQYAGSSGKGLHEEVAQFVQVPIQSRLWLALRLARHVRRSC
jgi:hypothetical protein